MDDVRQLILSTYNAQAAKLSAQYQSVNSVDVLAGLNARLPRYRALDIACGNGRHARWLAEQGLIVDAVDGAVGMIAQARQQNPHQNITYGVDLMPDLSSIRDKIKASGEKYDVVVMSAAWMHLDDGKRRKMFSTLAAITNPGAMMFITLRHGPAPVDRPMFAVSAAEMKGMAATGLMHFEHIVDAREDKLGRGDVWWDSVCLRVPDRHTEVLPTYRDGIIQSAKNSSYKLGFAHCFLNLIRTQPGLVREHDDARYAIPLGPMLPHWIRLYDGLAEAGLQQIKSSKRINDPMNATRRFSEVAGTVRADDFVVGHVFEGAQAQAALRMLGAAQAAMLQPTQFITRPGGKFPVFTASRSGLPFIKDTHALVLDDNLSGRFGEILVSRDIVHAGREYAGLIDAGIVQEWARFSSRVAGQDSVDELVNVQSRLEIALKAA
ncbi:MAG: methyltransferase type 11 [Micavibrio sp.]|nr:methyltransferase type 11 [Micavibrio sp.]